MDASIADTDAPVLDLTTRQIWERLSADTRDALLQNHWDVNVDDTFWYESVISDFKERMKEIGIEVEQVYYSGFSSQGDGACFEGYVQDWDKFVVAAGLPNLAKLPSEVPDLRWKHSGHYYHEYCMSFDGSNLHAENPYDEDDNPLRYHAWIVNYGEGGPYYKHEEAFIEFVRGQARDLYRRLEEEYDDLTSEEAITEYLLDCKESEELLDLIDDVEPDNPFVG